MRNQVTRQGFAQPAISSHVLGTSYLCKGVILWKQLRPAMMPFRDPNITASLHHKLAMWPGVKLQVLLGPFKLQHESGWEGSLEGPSQATAHAAIAEKRAQLICRGGVTWLHWLPACWAMSVGHFRATSNKAKRAFPNRNSGRMQHLGEHARSDAWLSLGRWGEGPVMRQQVAFWKHVEPLKAACGPSAGVSISALAYWLADLDGLQLDRAMQLDDLCELSLLSPPWTNCVEGRRRT